MRKRGFEPWIAALEAETPYMRLGGSEVLQLQTVLHCLVFLGCSQKGARAQNFHSPWAIAFGGTCCIDSNDATSGNGFKILTERLIH